MSRVVREISLIRGFTDEDQLAFTRKRLAGGISYGEDDKTQRVRTRSVEVDLGSSPSRGTPSSTDLALHFGISLHMLLIADARSS